MASKLGPIISMLAAVGLIGGLSNDYIPKYARIDDSDFRRDFKKPPVRKSGKNRDAIKAARKQKHRSKP